MFDTANTLLVVEMQDGKETGRETVSIDFPTFPRRIRQVMDLNLEVIICNGISRPLSQMLDKTGPEIIAWRSGPVDEVLQAFLDGSLNQPRFVISGCPRGQNGHGGRGKHCGRQRGPGMRPK